jgi:transcriptional regulator with XRE-family HTH domain
MGRGARRRPRLLAAKLREIRDRLGPLSQCELVERMGLTDYIDQGDISDFERGIREPDLPTLKAYADKSGISTDYLIDDEVDLPDELSSARRTAETGAIMNTATIMLWLPTRSEEGSAREESRARKTIEKAHLERYEMKKLKDDEYELTVPYHNDADLDEQIYALFGAINTEAKRRKCSVKVDMWEKGTDRYW